MKIIYFILMFIGIIVGSWYFKNISNPMGKINYPEILREPTGHIISWLIMIIAFISAILLIA